MTAILFLVILAVLVFVHELGHFLAAKKLGVRVDEFALGFPPRVYSREWRGTRYSLNLIPFGGYVAIFGENPDDASTAEGAKDSFQRKPRWAQAVILLAGVAMNVLLAWILFTIAFTIGVHRPVDDTTVAGSVTVVTVSPDSPADKAGLRVGDVIFAVGSTTADSVETVTQAIRTSTSTQILVAYFSDTEEPRAAKIEPAVSAEGNRMIGVGLGVIAQQSVPLHVAIWQGAQETYYQTVAIAKGLVGLIIDAVQGKADTSMITGPVGIASMVGDASRFGVSQVLMFVGFISLNLAVLNALPFPALDGGRVLFVAIEAIIRRPLPRALQNYVNLAGFALLMLLIIVLTVRDVGRLF